MTQLVLSQIQWGPITNKHAQPMQLKYFSLLNSLIIDRRGATSTTIDTSQRLSSASSPHYVQMEIQDTPIQIDTSENYTAHD